MVRGTLPENALLKDQNTFASIAEAKGTLPETVISEPSVPIIAKIEHRKVCSSYLGVALIRAIMGNMKFYCYAAKILYKH